MNVLVYKRRQGEKKGKNWPIFWNMNRPQTRMDAGLSPGLSHRERGFESRLLRQLLGFNAVGLIVIENKHRNLTRVLRCRCFFRLGCCGLLHISVAWASGR